MGPRIYPTHPSEKTTAINTPIVKEIGRMFDIFVEFKHPSKKYFYKVYNSGENPAEIFTEVYNQFKNDPEYAGIRLKEYEC